MCETPYRFEFTPRMKLELIENPFCIKDTEVSLKFQFQGKFPVLTDESFSIPLSVDAIHMYPDGGFTISNHSLLIHETSEKEKVIKRLLLEYFKQYKAPLPTDYQFPEVLSNRRITSFVWQDTTTDIVTVADFKDFSTTKTIVVDIIHPDSNEIQVELKFDSKSKFILQVMTHCTWSGPKQDVYSEKWVMDIFDKLDNETLVSLCQEAHNNSCLKKPEEKPKEIKQDKPESLSKLYKIKLEDILGTTNYEFKSIGSIKFMRIENPPGQSYIKTSEWDYVLDILSCTKGVTLSDSRDDEYLKILLDLYVNSLIRDSH